MKRLKVSKWFSILIGLTLLVATLTSVHAKSSLVFDEDACILESFEVDSQTIYYYACRDIVYVSNPVVTEAGTLYHQMNFFFPEEYYQDGSINDYTSETAPILFLCTSGGYMPGTPADSTTGQYAEVVKSALLMGYVVAGPGARGSPNYDPVTGKFNGKAPAGIVDLKAAVGYLRYNDNIMPGDAEKIISSGTSAGGAFSSLLGATGNNTDYKPYLEAIGAANKHDDIYAASCYCPIQNLDNADTAYEWQFNGIGTSLPGYDEDVSDDLKSMFPKYLNSLGLFTDYQPRNDKGKGLEHAPGQVKEGTPLTLDENGEGNFKDYVVSFVIASAQEFLDGGGVIPDFDWITIEDGTVTAIDFYGFSAEPTYPGRLPFKMPPAFDSLGLGSFENALFGTEDIYEQHFTKYGFENSTVGAPRAEKKIVKLMNPTYYIGAPQTTIAQYWRIRHGTIDHHTSLAIPVILATMLENRGYDVDFAMPWEQDHGGHYDLVELFTWIDMICKN